MKKDKKSQIVIIGTGVGSDFKSLTIESYHKIMKAKNIYCRIDYDPIIKRLREKGKKVVSLTNFYKKHASFEKTYEGMVKFLIKEAEEKGEIVYLVPGHPFVCEYPTQLIIKRANKAGLEVQVLSNLSFLDSLFTDVGFEPGLGMQFVAASELFKKEIYNSLSSDLICVVACLSNKLQPGKKMSSYEKFLEFLHDKYNTDHQIYIVYQDPRSFKQKVITAKICEINNHKEVLTTCRATCLIFPQKP